MAYGTSLPKGSIVSTSRDTSRLARALKRAIIGGLNLAGVNVEDLELATVPLTRFQVRNGPSHGGITVRLAPGDPDSVEIRFFDADGRDIDQSTQRKIERLLYREDFRRAFGGDIGDIVFPPRALEFYTAALERSVDIDRVRSRGFKIVLDYSFGAVSIVMPNVLTKIGAEVLAVNPFASTAAATADTGDVNVMRVAELVRASGSDLGFVIDPDGEVSTVIDDTGRILEPEELLLVLVSLLAEAQPGARVAVPVNATRAVEDIRGAESVVRTKLANASLMEAAAMEQVAFAGVVRRRVHLAGLPARVRRRGDAGEAARPPRRRRPPAVGDLRTAAVDAHRARDDRHAVGAQGRGHARDRRAGRHARGRADRRGEDHRRRRVGARAPRSRGRVDARLGGGGQRPRGAAVRAGVRTTDPPHPPLAA